MAYKIRQAFYKDKYWNYDVSSDGEIFTRPNRYNGFKTKKMSISINKNGYCQTGFSEKMKFQNVRVHCLVAQTFIKNPKNLKFVNHKNGVKTDNRVDNLEWVSAAQNTHHAVNSGLIKSNINSTKVKEIKKLLKTKMKGIEIAKKYNVPASLISKIKQQRIWVS